jgi:hypothetical protein
MIKLASDCLLFEMTSGESVPLSAEMISVELSGASTSLFDPEFVKQAAGAVFHYFRTELGCQTITVAEFAGALERVLRGFGLAAQMDEPAPKCETQRVVESDLRLLASESGKGCELFFFPRLRDELRAQLRVSPPIVRFRGLRGCVKQLAGARRWCPRCQTLHNRILEYLRHCATVEAGAGQCALLVR